MNLLKLMMAIFAIITLATKGVESGWGAGYNNLIDQQDPAWPGVEKCIPT